MGPRFQRGRPDHRRGGGAAGHRRAHLDDRAPLDDGRARHNDRYLAAYLSERVGSEFDGTIAGVARVGLFVKLDETGADGLVPISALGREYFTYDPDSQTLTGEKSRRVIGLGQRVTVRLAEAVPITGGLLFELLEVEGRRMPIPPRRSGPGAPRRKLAKSRRRDTKSGSGGRRR
jgi:ribonuclease R